MYRIAIPSYNRSVELGKRTLKMLDNYGFDKDIIDIFVNTDDDFNKYTELYPDYNIIKGVKGLKEIREFIFNYYADGEHILCIDDDIDDILMKNPKEWEASSYYDEKINLKQEIDFAFNELEEHNCGLWGVYPVKNHFFMKNNVSYDLKFCSGGFFGVRIDKDCLKLNVSQFDDYERCIRYFKKYGKIIRLNYLTMDTKIGVNKGGMNDDKQARKDMWDRDLSILMGKYYDYVNVKKKKGGEINPVLRTL